MIKIQRDILRDNPDNYTVIIFETTDEVNSMLDILDNSFNVKTINDYTGSKEADLIMDQFFKKDINTVIKVQIRELGPNEVFLDFWPMIMEDNRYA